MLDSALDLQVRGYIFNLVFEDLGVLGESVHLVVFNRLIRNMMYILLCS